MQVEMKTWLPWSEVAGGPRLTIEPFATACVRLHEVRF